MAIIELIRCEESTTSQANGAKAEEIMEVCSDDSYYRESTTFEAGDLQTVGYMKYIRDTGLELRESVDGVRALFLVAFYIHNNRNTLNAQQTISIMSIKVFLKAFFLVM